MNFFPRLNGGGGERSSLLRIMQVFFLVVGLLTLGYCAYVVAEAHFYQTYESRRLDQMRQGRPASTGEFLMNEIARLWNRVTGLNPPGGGKAKQMSEGSLVGRLAAPRIGLSSVVLEGVDNKVLRVAAGHIPGTSLPGQAGNVALAGHRDTVFRELRAVRKGDSIALATPQGDYRYRVVNVEVVPPDDVSVLKPTREPTLTLVTCYPFNYVGSAPLRFVVRAQEIAPAQAAIGVVDAGLANPLASGLPSALPGETLATPLDSARAHRRRSSVRRKSRKTTHEAREGDLATAASPEESRQRKTRALALRMRTEWSRLFGRLKDRSAASP